MTRSTNHDTKVYVVDYGRPHLVLRWFDRNERRWRTKTAETANRAEAGRRAAKLEAKLEQDNGPEGDITWARFRLRYEDEYLSTLAKPTRKKAHTALQYLEKELRPDRLRDITADSLSAMFGRMRTKNKERAESTLAGYGRQISAALGWAVDMGLLTKRPKMPRQQRYRTEAAKSRAVTDAEFAAMLAAVPEVVGEKRAASWLHYLRGMWWSGLRLEESINELHWTDTDKMRVDLSGKHPVLIIRAEGEKGYKDRVYPVAPEFGVFLQATPEAERTGYVFNPLPHSYRGDRPSILTIGRTVGKIGEEAKVLTKDDGSGKKFATIHDFRRAFGFRWANRVMPAVLRELMRHAAIDTTMRYYVTQNAQATGDVIWNAAPLLDSGSILGSTYSPAVPVTSANS